MENQQQLTTRSQIKIAAVDLMIMYGYRGLRFADIADRLEITRANVHYHFGTKNQLAEEAILDYVQASLAELRQIFRTPDMGFGDRIERMIDYCHKRYIRYNDEGQGDKPWSLVGRMRLEAEMLTGRSREVLGNFTLDLKESVRIAVAGAKNRGEFPAEAPTDEMVSQLVAIIDCAPIITQYSGLFSELEHLFRGYLRLINYAYPSKATVR